MPYKNLKQKLAHQRKRTARLAAKFAETGRVPLRAVAIWPKKTNQRKGAHNVH
jgi:hypothetical protein